MLEKQKEISAVETANQKLLASASQDRLEKERIVKEIAEARSRLARLKQDITNFDQINKQKQVEWTKLKETNLGVEVVNLQFDLNSDENMLMYEIEKLMKSS